METADKMSGRPLSLDLSKPIAEQLQAKTELAKLLDEQANNGKEKNLKKVRILFNQYLPLLMVQAQDNMKKNELISAARTKMNEACERGDYDTFLALTKQLLSQLK